MFEDGYIMSIFTHFQQVSSTREGGRTKTHIGRSLTCCNEESTEVLSLQSGVGDDQRRPRLAHSEVLPCQAVQALIHRHAQLEGDALVRLGSVVNIFFSAATLLGG